MVVIKKLTKTPKPSKGRKKIEIKKITNKSSQQVTFSKRRSGLFKKASELCVLCGAHIAIIVFSPVHKIFCFGHPNVDFIVDRYIRGTSLDPDQDGGGEEGAIADDDIVPALRALNEDYDEVLQELAREKQRGVELKGAERDRRAGGSGDGFWWDKALDNDLAVEELEQYVIAVEELMQKVAMKADDMMMRSLLQPYGATVGAAVNAAEVGDADMAVNHLLHENEGKFNEYGLMGGPSFY
ncbi:agamous-like MADS-box protein AGL62 [Rhodamnia argentea]|uniref:Agamous-like MADS-box protein AGL62 n=1 Tax=Rhodamnia argentea TaxID=178133 RepID=A0A8B8QTN2_9MYRT|nr:agamous-like MADS-box protein AGL62 [Rhodamnia argentea]